MLSLFLKGNMSDRPPSTMAVCGQLLAVVGGHLQRAARGGLVVDGHRGVVSVVRAVVNAIVVAGLAPGCTSRTVAGRPRHTPWSKPGHDNSIDHSANNADDPTVSVNNQPTLCCPLEVTTDDSKELTTYSHRGRRPVKRPALKRGTRQPAILQQTPFPTPP